MGLPEKIKKLRMNNKISQKRLADAIGVAQSSINYWEKGQRIPSIAAAQKLADFFNITLDQLYEDNETPLYDASSYTAGHSYVSETIAPYGSDSTKRTMDTHGNSGLSRKDERDIAKDLNTIMEKLKDGEDGPASFEGTDIPKEDLELFAGQIELMLRRLKAINKEKYSSKNAPKEQD